MINPPIEKWLSPELMLSILRKTQEMTMQENNLYKSFSVDVYSDRSLLSESPWLRIGEFEELDDAIDACKKVVDDFLHQPLNAFIEPEQLVRTFLCFGDVPVINGAKNLPSFDVYEYLAQRCREFRN